MLADVMPGRSPLPPADYLEETRRLYDSLGYDSYRWAERTETAPWAAIERPLSECTVMLVGSGAVYQRGQIAFSSKDDTSVRLIPTEVDTAELRTAHFAYDQTDARSDINCVFPIDRLNDLADEGFIGGIAPVALSFMGGIYSARRLEEETAPLLLDQVARHEPDIVLLVPV